MQPQNYVLGGTVDPGAAFTAGLQNGQAQQMAIMQQQAMLAQQQQQQAVIGALVNKPNPTARDYARAIEVVPSMREALKQSWDIHNADQQQGLLQHTGQVFAALENGQAPIAAKLLRDRAELIRESDPNESRALESWAQIADANPELARKFVGMKLAAVPGGDKVITNLQTMGAEQRAADKAPADLRTAVATAQAKEAEAAVAPQKAQEDLRTAIWNNANIKSQIQERAARYGLDRDKLTSETQAKVMELNHKFGQLPESAVRIVNDSAVQATASAQSAGQMFDLADRLSKAGGGYGGFATASEWLAKATGNQDSLTGMRQEYTRIMSQGVIKMLPPGPASDKDIALAREGFPPATADAKYLASFLRGMAKLQAYDSALSNAKSEWAGAVGHLGPTKSDVEVTGIKVPAGATFVDFAKQFIGKQAEGLAQSMQAGGRSYMRWADHGQ